MGRELRAKSFKLGCIHGKFDAKNKRSEASLQRKIFIGQRLKIFYSRKCSMTIRLIGYEIPIESPGRGSCVDLMGYDTNLNLFLIELKKGISNEGLKDINLQIKGYADSVKKIRENIENEFEATFFFRIQFKAIRKMILAPRNFYKNKKKRDADDTIDYAYFQDDILNTELKEATSVHLWKKHSY